MSPLQSHDLIICCAKKTEPNYFAGCIDFIYSKSNAVKFDIYSDGIDPKTIAIKLNNIVKNIQHQKDIKYHKIWVVFDKDNFKDNDFDKAISDINKKANCTVLWSNVCFEVWLLLYFHYFENDIGAKDCVEKLSDSFKTKLNKDYDKTNTNVYQDIANIGDLHSALDRADRLLKKDVLPSKNTPATTVFEFFEHYTKYLNIDFI